MEEKMSFCAQNGGKKKRILGPILTSKKKCKKIHLNPDTT